ncbi:GTP-binding protein [Halomontanus rarus]|uniref:GTP-binding protein n=1 Tax=Halomontanus rarus TaxID=3034020 RepID=UPI001A992C5D
MPDRIPVTVVSGSLGAGKTTLLNHLLETADRRLAILVNDMGEVNIDASLLEGVSDLTREGIAELSNGCICCELQDDLETEVRSLARRYDFDHLVVESSGISEPAPVARLFTVGDAAARYEVDSLVTVVDARLLSETVAGDSPSSSPSGSPPLERETPPDAEDRPLSDLLVEQLEVSNVVLLNKCDLLADDELHRLEAVIATLQPDAAVIRTVYSEVDADELLGRGSFDPQELGELAGWQRALAAARAGDDSDRDGSDRSHDWEHHDHDTDHIHRTPETVYGIDSVTVRRHRPLDPERFADFLRELPPSVVRLKGPCWIAGRDDLVIQLSGAGRSVYAEAEGNWIASLPDSRRDLYRRNHPDLPWDETHGDRRTELVFIGTDLESAAIERSLEACLTEPGTTGDAAAGSFPTERGERTVLRE